MLSLVQDTEMDSVGCLAQWQILHTLCKSRLLKPYFFLLFVRLCSMVLIYARD